MQDRVQNLIEFTFGKYLKHLDIQYFPNSIFVRDDDLRLTLERELYFDISDQGNGKYRILDVDQNVIVADGDLAKFDPNITHSQISTLVLMEEGGEMGKLMNNDGTMKPRKILKDVFDFEEVAEGIAPIVTFTEKDIEQMLDYVRVELGFKVNNFQGLSAMAQTKYMENWGDSEWFPKTPSEAVFEVVLASNNNPSPDEMGFEIQDYRFESETPEESALPSP